MPGFHLGFFLEGEALKLASSPVPLFCMQKGALKLLTAPFYTTRDEATLKLGFHKPHLILYSITYIMQILGGEAQ